MLNQLETNTPAIIQYSQATQPSRTIFSLSTMPDEERILKGFLEETSKISKNTLTALRKKYPDLLSLNK